MAAAKRITSIAQVRSRDDRILTDCYVLGIGFTGLTAVSERPVPAATKVFVDLAYVNEAGGLEGETLEARIERCEPRPGAHLLGLRFLTDLRRRPGTGLARYIRRELGLKGRTGPDPPDRAGGAGTA